MSSVRYQVSGVRYQVSGVSQVSGFAPNVPYQSCIAEWSNDEGIPTGQLAMNNNNNPMSINKTRLKVIFAISAVLIQVSILSKTAVAQNDKELLIVTFGNSTTAPRRGVDSVYAVRIHGLLNRAGIPNKVINSGIGGSHSGSIKDNDFTKIEHGMDRFEKAVLNHHADWVTLNFGLNDAYQDKGIGTSSRIPVEKYIQNLNYFITQVKKDNTKVIVLTPNPVGSKLDRFRYDRLTQYRNAAKSVAKANKVYFIDSWKLFYRHTRKDPKSIDSLLPDGTHPNDTGHKLIADGIVKIIKRVER